MKTKKQPDKKEKSIADLIHEIKTGTLDPGVLNKEQRQLCVEALHFDSVSPTAIAQFLKVADRTIRRDMADIRKRNALSPDLELAKQIIGEFLQASRIHRANLMKMARSADASVAERAQAEYYSYMVLADSMVKMQSVGYLPKSADSLIVTQKNEDDRPDEKLAVLSAELADMADLAATPEQASKLLEIKETVTQETSNEEEKK